MLKHQLSDTLSDIAGAKLTIALNRERCRNCYKTIDKYELCVVGTSFDITQGYKGGWFCLPCWQTNNYHPINEREIKMTTETTNKLNVPKVRPISEVADLEVPWQYKHSDLTNKEFIIFGYEQIETQYGTSFLADCLVNDERVRVLIGGLVLMQQLEKVKGKFPVSVTIVRLGRYYSFQ